MKQLIANIQPGTVVLILPETETLSSILGGPVEVYFYRQNIVRSYSAIEWAQFTTLEQSNYLAPPPPPYPTKANKMGNDFPFRENHFQLEAWRVIS